MKPLFQIFVIGALLVLLATLSSAQVPQMINYQGKLTTPAGAPVNDTLHMVFTIYADTGGTNLLWAESQSAVIVEKGVFNVLLGSVDSIPYSVFDGSIRYLGVKVEHDPEITPRKPIVSVAYAYRANVVDGGPSSGWVDDGTVVRLEDSTDIVGIGTANPDPRAKLHIKTAPGAYIRFDHGSDTTWFVGSNSTDDQSFQINRGDAFGSWTRARFRVDGDIELAVGGGNVGIGTSPRENLDIAAYPGGGKLAITNPGMTIETGDVLGEIMFYGADGDDQVGAEIKASAVVEWTPGSAGANLRFLTTPAGSSTPMERVVISDSGNVGIGTTSPQRALHISDVLRLEPRASAPSNPSEGDIYVNSTDHHIYCYLGDIWKQLD
jgi:hypothetical protein